jgi:hypothetical protein
MIRTTRRLFPRLQRAAHAAPLGRNVSGPTHSRKRGPPATRRSALELLDASREGCTEAVMLAHGFTVDVPAGDHAFALGVSHDRRGQPQLRRP